jgi:hypothetical protein
MKKINLLMVFSILLLSFVIVVSGCKKKSDDTPFSPAFIVTATTVQLVGGGEGLQFGAKCTNDDVKMTKVMIVDPIQSPAFTYNVNGNYFVRNEVFFLQGTDEAYTKQIGTWKFTFVGNRTSNNASFSVTTTLAVGK